LCVWFWCQLELIGLNMVWQLNGVWPCKRTWVCTLCGTPQVGPNSSQTSYLPCDCVTFSFHEHTKNDRMAKQKSAHYKTFIIWVRYTKIISIKIQCLFRKKQRKNNNKTWMFFYFLLFFTSSRTNWDHPVCLSVISDCPSPL
jgi:hypothetical protein